MTDIPHILGGRYEVGDLIGRGGMAQVHIGYDTRLSRTVAIKVLRSDLASDPTFLARFRREAQSAAALNHPAIVAIYDTGEEKILSENGRTVALPYIVMEYVKGRTVSKLLSNGQALPINEAVQITVGVLSALEYSHYEGIIHRDIKPGNIMITQDGKVKVMDFGIARAVADSSATMTSTNSVVGTAQYLSPEQARGEVVDARSDLYSTGCLLYELLTGKPPFQGDSAVAVAYQHVSEQPKAPSLVAPDVPEVIDRVVMKSLAKKRDERYQTAADMRADLLAAVRGEPVTAPAIGTWETRIGAPTMVADGPSTAVNPVIPPLNSTHDSPVTTTTDIPPAVQDEHHSRKVWWGVLIALVVVAAVGGLAYAIFASGVLGNHEPTVTMVKVPDLADKDQTAATAALQNAGLKIAVGDAVEDDNIPEGLYVSSNPAVGALVKPGSTVTVHFSAGKGKVTVPDVSGLTQQQARDALKEAGLTAGNTDTVDEPGIAKDVVVQTDPAKGSSVTSDTPIQLSVASGEVSLGSLTGMSLDEAQKALTALKLQFDTDRINSPEPEGTVIDQSPAAGKVEYNARVKLTVSLGPAQLPTPPSEPSNPSNPDSSGGNQSGSGSQSGGTSTGGNSGSGKDQG
ncbi:MAG: Stk1 family PASTA domain-containing Ser/Thr kinase [Actinomycetaceae bacterium]|nr:Stk1 family PASTA domain-containing Ser/Thr kinase [Arcanobacterium sp.]MDD7687245.1 Stk1 family PASTA domain-containing Ser/Thr kinase [Actinomycetaceae bacterium]MDY5273457.1 Stk1 family PASTA domain-containing Ser/Thr kinase [Arcanobacterium sp.]